MNFKKLILILALATSCMSFAFASSDTTELSFKEEELFFEELSRQKELLEYPILDVCIGYAERWLYGYGEVYAPTDEMRARYDNYLKNRHLKEYTAFDDEFFDVKTLQDAAWEVVKEDAKDYYTRELDLYYHSGATDSIDLWILSSSYFKSQSSYDNLEEIIVYNRSTVKALKPYVNPDLVFPAYWKADGNQDERYVRTTNPEEATMIEYWHPVISGINENETLTVEDFHIWQVNNDPDDHIITSISPVEVKRGLNIVNVEFISGGETYNRTVPVIGYPPRKDENVTLKFVFSIISKLLALAVPVMAGYGIFFILIPSKRKIRLMGYHDNSIASKHVRYINKDGRAYELAELETFRTVQEIADDMSAGVLTLEEFFNEIEAQNIFTELPSHRLQMRMVTAESQNTSDAPTDALIAEELSKSYIAGNTLILELTSHRYNDINISETFSF